MWKMNVTRNEYSQISVLANNCGKLGLFDEAKWLEGLKRIGVYPVPEGAGHIFDVVVKDKVTVRFEPPKA